MGRKAKYRKEVKIEIVKRFLKGESAILCPISNMFYLIIFEYLTVYLT